MLRLVSVVPVSPAVCGSCSAGTISGCVGLTVVLSKTWFSKKGAFLFLQEDFGLFEFKDSFHLLVPNASSAAPSKGNWRIEVMSPVIVQQQNQHLVRSKVWVSEVLLLAVDKNICIF